MRSSLGNRWAPAVQRERMQLLIQEVKEMAKMSESLGAATDQQDAHTVS